MYGRKRIIYANSRVLRQNTSILLIFNVDYGFLVATALVTIQNRQNKTNEGHERSTVRKLTDWLNFMLM